MSDRLFRRLVAPAIAAVTWVQSGNSVSAIATPLKWKMNMTDLPKGTNYLSPQQVCQRCGKNKKTAVSALRTLLEDKDSTGWNAEKATKFKVTWDILNKKKIARCLLCDSHGLEICDITGKNGVYISLTPKELAEGVFTKKIEIPADFWEYNSIYEGRSQYQDAYEECMDELLDNLDFSQNQSQKKEVT